MDWYIVDFDGENLGHMLYDCPSQESTKGMILEDDMIGTQKWLSHVQVRQLPIMQVDSNKTIVILGGEHLAMIKEVMSLFPVKFKVKDMERLSLYLYQNH